MEHYKANLRDLEFNLFEVFGLGERLGRGPFAELDEQTARGILAEVTKLAEGPVAASFTDADRNPPVFDPATGTATLPESFKRSYRALFDAEWWRLDLPPELGGQESPRSLHWALAELILGANPAVHMYSSGPAFARLLWELGTDDQKKMAARMIDHGWGSTMVLTEPDAGSDVGAGKAKATDQGDGTWHIEGVKRFITSAEHDLSDNIIHLVLARPVGAGPGTKGLSLFVVPKFLFDVDTGELGARNGAYVTNVEHKMGLKASTTCELRFGEQEPAVGYLVGGVHDGIAQMFKVIEFARMMVGAKAMATLSTGYLNALEFAKTRVQSADLTQASDKTAPRVTIIHHPDVRRTLMLNKAYAEGLRAIALYTASVQDQVQLAELSEASGLSEASELSEASGLSDVAGLSEVAGKNPEAMQTAEAINDLLLPIVKGFSSERAYEQLAQSLQTLGGSGYLQDYPIEQYIRDAKIDTLYEGTTAIQGQDLFFRKIVRNKGQALGAISAEISQFLDSIAGVGRLKEDRDLVQAALAETGAMVAAMVAQATSAQEDPRNIYKVGQNTTRLLLTLGDLMVGYLLLRQAAVALTKLDSNGLTAADRAFYDGKVAVSRFFSQTVLPELRARRRVAESVDNSLMDVAEAAF